MAAVGFGSGKLILFGEHAAVFGYPAIGVSLPEGITISLHGPRAERWGLEGVPPGDRQVLQRIMDRLEVLLPELRPCGRRRIRLESSVPRGVGFGSSAALCTALSGAALTLINGSLTQATNTRTWQLAHELESLFHGTPSGIDTGLSLLPGVTGFLPRPPALPAWERMECRPLWLVVGAVPRSENSGALIRGIGERMRSGEPAVRKALSELGRIAEEAKKSITAAAPCASIGRLADHAMDTLGGLGLSHASLDLLLEEGRQSGALGGKLSGAGGGGAFFLVCEEERTALETAGKLAKAAGGRGIALAAAPRALRIGG